MPPDVRSRYRAYGRQHTLDTDQPKEARMRTKITTALVIALTATAIAAPAAGARPADQFLQAPTAQSSDATGGTGSGESSSAASPDGFDWTDAGIGAVAMLSMLGLGAGAVSVARHSREQHPAVN
jgi:hypothetical protein